MHKVLLIQPDVKLADVIRPYLVKHFALDSAHDGISGFRKLKMTNPHVIVSDYELPYLSGLALLKFVRNTESFSSTPFMFFTKHNDVTKALGGGATAWLDATETTPDVLIEKIHYYLKNK